MLPYSGTTTGRSLHPVGDGGKRGSSADLKSAAISFVLELRAHKEKQVETLLVPERNAGEGGR